MLQGDEGTGSTQDTAAALLEETKTSLALSNPSQGDAAMSGYGVERDVSMAKTDQSGSSFAGTRQEGELKNSMGRYVLVGLLLAGLAVVFFVVILPKTNKRREQ
jgi:hypothetical protein